MLHNGNMNWDDAKEYCNARNANLLSIGSELENSFIKALIMRNSNDTVWTGGVTNDNSGTWIWDDGSPFEFTSWESGQPNEDRNKNYPVALYLSYTSWYDGDRSNKRSLICKK